MSLFSGISYLTRLESLQSIRVEYCDKLTTKSMTLINMKYSSGKEAYRTSRNRRKRRKKRMRSRKKTVVDTEDYRVDSQANPPSACMIRSLGHFLQFVPEMGRV